jgi:hypothetical protein
MVLCAGDSRNLNDPQGMRQNLTGKAGTLNRWIFASQAAVYEKLMAKSARHRLRWFLTLLCLTSMSDGRGTAGQGALRTQGMPTISISPQMNRTSCGVCWKI